MLILVTEFMRAIELSPIISSPSTITPTYSCRRDNEGSDEFRRGFREISNHEKARFNVLSWIFAVRFGVRISSFGDPRITKLHDYGIITPFRKDLEPFCKTSSTACLIGDR